MFVYYLERVFHFLNIGKIFLALKLPSVNMPYLPLLQHRNRELVIHELMASDPGFYVSILKDVFRATSEEASEPSKESRDRATQGYRILSSFRTVPGTVGNVVEYEKLNAWVSSVRTEASQADRSKIADQYIGHILAHAPTDQNDKLGRTMQCGDYLNKFVQQISSRSPSNGSTCAEFTQKHFLKVADRSESRPDLSRVGKGYA